ncbi:MAG: hypothetical protein ABGZ23_25195 [Fuerstiella sp.]
MTEFQHEDAVSTAVALCEVDGKLSQMSEEQGNASGLWRTRYALEDELKLHEISECDGQRLTPTQVRALDALMNGASQAEAAEAAGKSARWLWTQMNTGGEFLNAYRQAVQSLQKQSQLTALQRSRVVMDVVTSIAVDRKHKDCLKAAQLILQLNKR